MEKFKELSNSEMREVNGGFILPILKFVGFAFAGQAVVELFTDGWEQCRNDFNEGYNEVRRFRK